MTDNDLLSARLLRDMTPGWRRILYLLGCGLSNAEIGRITGCKATSIKSQMWGLYNLIGVDNRIEAVLFVREHPLLMKVLTEEFGGDAHGRGTGS